MNDAERQSRVPHADRCIIRRLIERGATEHPERLFARFASGEPDWSYTELRRRVVRTANALRHLGVEQGDRVLCWLPNGPDAVRLWLGLNYLGAVYVPLNPAFKGAVLEHVIRLSDARLIILDTSLAASLPPAARATLIRAVLMGNTDNAAVDTNFFLPANALDCAEETAPALENEIAPWDPPAIIFTSGTTGPSKGVLISYAHLWATVTHSPCQIGHEDRMLQYLPLFHIAGMAPVYQALVTGGSIAVLEQFRTSTFWRDVLKTGATDASIMGTVASFLLGLPRTEEEKNTPLRRLLVSPLTDETRALAKRIGAQYHTWFNMTEVSRPIISGINPTKNGTCGRPRAGVQVRIVDENDCEVPAGTIGELIVRTDAPWAMNSGYFNDPAATAQAWRNGWFHTGDAFKVDPEGDYSFIDRIKDSIRRRGENVSSFEVEREVLAYPGIKACAVVGVPSQYGDQDVLIVLEPQEGSAIDPKALIEFLLPRMAHYMIPRYVRILGVLPRTPTFRIRKNVLRDDGVTGDTWDRDAVGFSIRRHDVPKQ